MGLKITSFRKNIPAKSKYYDDLNALLVDKMEDSTDGVNVEEYIWLKPTKMVDISGQY